MAWAIYICPMVEGTEFDGRTVFRIKHQALADLDRVGAIRFSCYDEAIGYFEGAQAALDTIETDAECDKLADAATIDVAITAGERGQLVGALQSRGIPAKWISAGDTPRQIIRGIAGIFLFCQRFEGLHGCSVKSRGAALAAAWNGLSTDIQNELVAARDDHGWTRPNPRPSASYEDFLIEAGEQFQNTRIFIGGFEI